MKVELRLTNSSGGAFYSGQPILGEIEVTNGKVVTIKCIKLKIEGAAEVSIIFYTAFRRSATKCLTFSKVVLVSFYKIKICW
jgi:hypothetical protein